MDWRKVKTKLTLIAELKRAVKKIRLEVVVQSVEDFSKRMYRTLQNDGTYLRFRKRKIKAPLIFPLNILF